MKDLRKIIALFIFIFLIGVGIIVGSINQKLDETKTVEYTEVSKDTLLIESHNKKNV